MSLKIIPYWKKCFRLPIQRPNMSSSSSLIIHRQHFCYYLNRQTFNSLPPPTFRNRINEIGFDRDWHRVCPRIRCFNNSSSTFSLSRGKSTSTTDAVHEEDLEEEVTRYADSDVENLLGFLRTVVSNNIEFHSKALTATIKILFHRLQYSESPAEDQAILDCVETLYNPILTHLDQLDLDTLIRLLHIFVVLQAPRDHTILMSILILLEKKYRGHLNLYQIVHLEYILHHMFATSDSTLSTSLMSTLPLYFERRLNSPLEQRDLEILATEGDDFRWNLNSLPKDDPNIVQVLVDDILQNILHLNHIQAYNFLLFLTNSNVQKDIEEGDKLLPILFKILTEKIQLFNSDQLAILVTKCAEKYENGEEGFYNADFMNALHANDIRNIKAASIMGHVDDRFLYSVSSLAELPGRLMNPDLLLAFVHLFGTAGSEPFHMKNFIQQKILDQAVQTMLSPQLNVCLTLDLLAMGRKPFIEFTEKIFQPHGTSVDKIPLENCGLDKVGYGPIPILLIRQAMSSLHFDPNYEAIMSCNETLDYFQQAAKTQATGWEFPIQESLEMTLGGSDFVKTNLWHHGIHIDHCIVTNKEDGSLVKIPENFSLHDVQNDKTKLPIIVKVHPKHHYIATSTKLRGVYDLETKVLKTFNLSLLDVNLAKWQDLKDEERSHLLTSSMNECWKKTVESK